MPQDTKLEVTLYDSPESEGTTVEDVSYVSLVTAGTYGPPALIAPPRDQRETRAEIGERVLYINTGLVPMFEIVRTR